MGRAGIRSAPPTGRHPRSRVIPAALHTAVLERLSAIDPNTRRQHTTREVAAWLREAHGIDVHHATVGRLRVSVEKHTAAQVAAALREEIADAVPGILAKVKRATRRLDDLAGRSSSTKDVAAATNALTRALHELATLGGVAAPVSVDLTTNGHPIILRWVDAPVDDHAPAASPAAE